MFKKNREQLNETASEWVKGLPNYFKNVLAKLKDPKERTLKVAEVMQKAKNSTNNPSERKNVLNIINKLRDELPPITQSISEGEDTMPAKKTNLDMFLEGVESVEVSKKPKFHSIHRLYEAKDEDYKKDEKDEMDENEKPEEDEEELDEVIVNEKKDDAEEGEEHEAGESEADEAKEKEAGDDDEAGGKDEEPETDSDEEEGEEGEEEEKDESCDDEEEDGEEENLDEGLGDMIDKVKEWLNTTPNEQARKARAAELEKILATYKLAAPAVKSGEMHPRAALRASLKENKNQPEQADEMDEGSQGYAAGLKGVRKDAGAKNLKSGKNKVPTPKTNITGPKELIKKPTVAKGDTYPKSSVAGAARPGAPKVKKS